MFREIPGVFQVFQVCGHPAATLSRTSSIVIVIFQVNLDQLDPLGFLSPFAPEDNVCGN